MKRLISLIVLLSLTSVVFAGVNSKRNNLDLLTRSARWYLDSTNYISGSDDSGSGLNISGTVANLTVNRITESVTSFTAVSSTYTTLTATQQGYIVMSSTADYTLHLPAVSGNTGLAYEIVVDTVTAGFSAPTIKLDGSGSETINGSATNSELDNWYNCLKIVCDGDEWFIVSTDVDE